MRRWFLPDSPDLLGLLARQGEVTIRGIDAFCAWTAGDPSAATRVVALEHEADRAGREVLMAVRDSFVTPISPEDVYEISERMGGVLGSASNLVREGDLLGLRPDPALAEMADLIALGVRDLVRAFPDLGAGPDRATACADAAVEKQRDLEHVYRRAMSALLEMEDLRQVAGRRELYRRCSRIGDGIVGVAHRVWYAVVKEA